MMKKTVIIIFSIFLVIASFNITSSEKIINKINQGKDNRQVITTSCKEIVEMVNKVNERMVFYYFNKLMEFGSRYTGSENCSKAAKYIYNEFEKMGLDVEYHNWSFEQFKSSNIIATLKGVDPTNDAIVIISAHYDCTPGSLGADDDGSGVAAVLASAYIMSKYNFKHTIRFIAFSGEEVGLYGSFKYARDCYDNGDNIFAVLNADMIGYADTTEGGNIIRFFKVDRSEWIPEFAQNVAEKYSDLFAMSVEPVPNYRGADHQAFLDYGYDAVFIAHRDSYPWANTPDDTPDHINHTYQIKATKFLLAVLAELAIKTIDIQVIIKNPKEGRVYIHNTSILQSHFGKIWYADLRGTTIIFGRALASVKVVSEEEIERVIFCIDDKFISWDSNPPYEWKIEGKHYPLFGKHLLRIYAYTKSGKIATDEMDIRIFTFQYQYKK